MRWPWAAAVAGLPPGALAGAYLAGLLFFLNPDLPFLPFPVVRGLAAYALAGAVAGFAVAAVLAGRSGARAARSLPWSLTAVYAAAAVGYGVHASVFALLLPPGINVRLIKAALWLSGAALIGFYTALLHSLQARRYGARSRLAYCVLTLLTLVAVVERREAYRSAAGPSPRPSAVDASLRPRLVVVGLDGGTLDAVLPLAGQGRLPFLARMIRDGAYGRLESASPPRPAVLWTTLATGKLPYKHGVVAQERAPARFFGVSEPLRLWPLGIGFGRWGVVAAQRRPVDASDRRALALWEVVPRLGLASAQIGWPVTAPVSREPRFSLSDGFFRGEPGRQTAFPEEIGERALLFRVTPHDLDPERVARFGGPPPPEVAEALAGDRWRVSLALFLLDPQRDVAAAFLALDGLAAANRAWFGGHAATRLEGAQRPEYREAAQMLAAYYAGLDEAIEQIWERTPSPKLLAVVSPRGAAAPAGLGRAWGELVGDPAVGSGGGGAPDGLLLLYGDGVRAGALLTGAQLVDVAPTVLYGLGVPVARDLDGRVLTGAFDRAFLARQPVTFLPSYETLTGAAELGALDGGAADRPPPP